MDIVSNYILPNVILFGGLALICKYVEHYMGKYIENHEVYDRRIQELVQELVNRFNNKE